MNQPKKDINGRVLPYDDADIRSDDNLIRYFSELQYVEDKKSPTGRRLSSGIFSPSSVPNHGMSIDIEKLIIESGRESLSNVPDNLGAVFLETGKVRDLGFKVGKNPIKENPYHGEVWWQGPRFPKGKQRALRDIANIVKETN